MTPEEKLRSFELQVSPHLGSAYNLARWLIPNYADAEDAVQEAFLRAFSSLDSLRGENARPWLLAIVRNACLTLLEKGRRHAPTVALDEAADPVVASPDPEQSLVIASGREQVRQAIEGLPVEFREAIVLREMEGLSYREIAAATGVPMGTVMSRLARGRDFLKRVLARSTKEPA